MNTIYWSAARETKSGNMAGCRNFLLLLVMMSGTLVCMAHLEQPVHFSRQWAVHIEGGKQVADSIASKHGFANLGEVSVNFFFFLLRVSSLGITNLERSAE